MFLGRLRNFMGRLRYFTRYGLLRVYPWCRLHPITFDFPGSPVRLPVDYGLKAVSFFSVSRLVAVTGVTANYGQNAKIASFRPCPCIHNLPQAKHEQLQSRVGKTSLKMSGIISFLLPRTCLHTDTTNLISKSCLCCAIPFIAV